MQDQRQTILRRELIQLLGENVPQFLAVQPSAQCQTAACHWGWTRDGGVRGLAARPGLSQVQRESFGHLLKPWTDVANVFVGLALDRQREEHRLGRIFHIMPIFKDLEADVENHGRVTAHDFPRTAPGDPCSEIRPAAPGRFFAGQIQDIASRSQKDDKVAQPLHKTNGITAGGREKRIAKGSFPINAAHG